jgi:DNA uptake protein ComE-like DNA-binding protein
MNRRSYGLGVGRSHGRDARATWHGRLAHVQKGTPPKRTTPAMDRSQRGSVLIIVMWICFGVVALTLYFANSMSSELRAADNRVQDASARAACDGGVRYAAYLLGQLATGGTVPLATDYKAEQLPVGDAYFWFIGRDPNQKPSADPFFGIVDEASKINLNTASATMLSGLPTMTSDVAANILSWRGASNAGGAGNETYARLDPSRLVKGAPFETIDELRLVYGATLDVLLGEDTNRNGALDRNEDDADQSPPHDNQDGQLQPGILEYVTVYSRQSNTGRVNVTDASQPTRTRLGAIIQSALNSPQRTQQIIRRLGTSAIGSVAEFYAVSGLTAVEFQQIHTRLTASTGTTVQGLININTASEAVLDCIPGIGTDYASAIVSYRLAHPDVLTSLAWITQVITAPAAIRTAGRYITDQSYQFSVDVAAVGRNGRGYCREKVVFDVSSGTPRIVYRQDLTAYGWALGAQARQSLNPTQENSL